MPHSTNGPVTRRRRKKYRNVAKGMFGRRQNYRHAKESAMRAWRYSWFHRRRKKRDFRSLWITRLSAAARLHGLTYSRFIHLLSQAKIDLNRKSLSELAIRDPKAFEQVVQAAKAAAK
jgi:large subunit ribosomal protein L20